MFSIEIRHDSLLCHRQRPGSICIMDTAAEESYNIDMSSYEESTEKKALRINLDPSIYGTFAEIGAGQEVARQFFQAGLASKTIAKTMSAYDMTISDEIYGKSSRYVCMDRVEKMLEHEYELLEQRLKPCRGEESRFFAFADTVASSNRKRGPTDSHGWMGLRFQKAIGGPCNEIIVHVRLWDSLRLQQQDALGILGVNLLYAAFYHTDDLQLFVKSLMDRLNNRRIEIDMIRFQGDDLKGIDNRLASLELVKQKHTEAVMFDSDGNVQLLSDELYGTPALVMRGTFRPVTSTHLQIIEKGNDQLCSFVECKKDPKVFLEMTIHSLREAGKVEGKDFLERVDTITALGYNVLLSNFNLFYQLKNYLRTCTHETIAMVIGAPLIEKILEEDHYKDLEGGILEAFSRLFDNKSMLLVFPFKDSKTCNTARSFFPPQPLSYLYKYLLETQHIVDIANCDDLDTSIHSEDVRKMLEQRDTKWEGLVPEKVRDLIKQKKLFGY